MAVLLVVLVVTNALTLGALWLRRRRDHDGSVEVDEVFSAPRPSGVTGRTRRLITIEVLNPIELVGRRGRVAGLAGSLAPGIARRVVYDQILKTLRRELADKHVLADVRLHELRPVDRIAPHVVEPPVSDAIHNVSSVDDPPAAVDSVTEIDLDQL